MEEKAKRISRNMAWLLAAALVFTLFPATALAADTHDVYNAADLVGAISSADSGDTIRLMASFNCTSGITIDGKALIFNLNGYTLNVSNSGSAVDGIFVKNNGSLDITGSGQLNASATGSFSSGVRVSDGSYAKVSSVSSSGTDSSGAFAYNSGSFIEVTGNVVTSGNFSSGAYAQDGGHIKVYGNAAAFCPAYAKGTDSVVEVMGNASTGYDGGYGALGHSGGEVTIHGNVTSTGGGYSAGVSAYNGGTVTVEGIVSATVSYVELNNIPQGKFDGVAGTDPYSAYLIYNDGDGNNTVRVRYNSAILDPITGSFDKKAENQADVATTIFFGYATTVTDVKVNDVSIGTDGSGNWSRSDRTLTFTKEYLAGQSVGSLVLSVVFDIDSPQTFTIAIHDTTPRVVTFDPQGGTVDPPTKTVTAEEAYGALPTPAKAGYVFGGWYTGAGGTGSKIESSTIVTIAADHTLYAKWSQSGGFFEPTYVPRTLTDLPTGVTVSGNSIHELAKLTVSPLVLHPNDPVCDAIRKAQAEGQLILGFDISLSFGFLGTLTVSIPVGSQYNGQNVTILHCVNGRLETIVATVVNGMAKFTVNELSPFAVTTGLPVPGEITGIPNTGDAANSWGFLLIGLAAACAGYMVMKRRKA